ncbi:hypothetical protein TNCV_3271351 [Trichonephila clavipes]|nr:hypothetical protein TNCV_3271351 [Trichonephila clavipes]
MIWDEGSLREPYARQQAATRRLNNYFCFLCIAESSTGPAIKGGNRGGLSSECGIVGGSSTSRWRKNNLIGRLYEERECGYEELGDEVRVVEKFIPEWLINCRWAARRYVLYVLPLRHH